jgi:hypothetical protein
MNETNEKGKEPVYKRYQRYTNDTNDVKPYTHTWNT